MNILFLERYWPVFGGGQTVTRILANAFCERGHKVHVVYFNYNDGGAKVTIDSRVIEHYLSQFHCDIGSSYDMEDTEHVGDVVCEIINSNDIDIVINQFHPYSFVRPIKEKTNAKVIWCLHGMFLLPYIKPKINDTKRWLKHTLFPWHYKKKMVPNAIATVNKAMPYIDKFVFLSDIYANEYLYYAGDKYKDKITAIGNAISISAKEADILKVKEKIVLYVGRISEEGKRISMILKSWQIITRKWGIDDWHLVIVGEGDDLESYKNYVQKIKLRNVHFEGFQNPVPYYAKSSLFVMTSSYEGVPMVVLEAQKMGVVPIVMDSFPAIHDVVKDGYNGVLTPNNDITAFAESVHNLMKDDTLRNRLKANGEQSCQQFSMDNIVDKWETLFEQLLQE